VEVRDHDTARETIVVPSNQATLRVLQVSARYFPYIGGVQTHVYEVSRRLRDSGVDVTILSTDPTGQLPTEEQSDGINILRVRAWPAKRDYYFAPGIYQIITQGGWDIVHCQGCHALPAPLAMLAAWHAHIPCVVTFHTGGHSSSIRNKLRPVQWAMLRPLLARAERLIAVSKFEAELFQKRLKLPADRFVVIPNGSQLPEFAGLPARGAQGTLIVSVGRLERYKGHQRIISALPKVRAEYPDVRLRIVGTGSYGPSLRRLAQELGVADQVEIRAIPSDDRAGMASLLSQASLVTLLSEYEAHPIATMEALALKRPVLVSRTSGLAELADQGLARAIPLQSTPNEVAAAILHQLRQPMVPANIALPTWERCVASLLAVYRDVVRNAPCVS
jgi:glycogen synthase